MMYIDIIIYLSAISNDPLGEFDKKITNDINFLKFGRLEINIQCIIIPTV